MAIEKPKWCPPGTVMTKRGWENHKTGELLASRKFSEEQVREWRKAHGLQRKSPTKKAEEKPVPAQEQEAEKIIEEVVTQEATEVEAEVEETEKSDEEE